MAPKRRLTGKFWPEVRERIWGKAEELHAADFYKVHEENITQPTRSELRRGGYFHKAKILVLREVRLETRGRRYGDFKPPTLEEWQAFQAGGQDG